MGTRRVRVDVLAKMVGVGRAAVERWIEAKLLPEPWAKRDEKTGGRAMVYEGHHEMVGLIVARAMELGRNEREFGWVQWARRRRQILDTLRAAGLEELTGIPEITEIHAAVEARVAVEAVLAEPVPRPVQKVAM